MQPWQYQQEKDGYPDVDETEEPMGHKYPELDRIAKIVADRACREIEWFNEGVESEMPYKNQYVLEEVAKILEDRV